MHSRKMFLATLIGWALLAFAPVVFRGFVLFLSTFFQQISPLIIGIAAVGFGLWCLYVGSPPLTTRVAQLLEEHTPMAGAFALSGKIVRGAIAILLPAIVYASFMVLRTGTGATWLVLVAYGLLVALLWPLAVRSLRLANLNLTTYPEDEVRKSLVQTGGLSTVAREKFQEATEAIHQLTEPDVRRIRLRRMASLAQVLKNRNLDPRREEQETLSDATVSALDRDIGVKTKTHEYDRLDLEDLASRSTIRADIAGEDARARSYEQKAPRKPQTAYEQANERIGRGMGADEARRRVEEEGIAKYDLALANGEIDQDEYDRLVSKLKELLRRWLEEQ